MPATRVGNSPRFAQRMHDISSWCEGDISLLNARRKKRYKQRKAAMEAYFTTEASLHDIVHRYHLHSEEALLDMVKKCLMQHEDGKLWGFRALLAGVTVIDHSSQPVSEESAPLVERKVDLDNNATASESTSSLPTNSEQTTILVDEAANQDDEEDADTAKRESVKIPLLPEVFNMEVPETPLPDMLVAEDSKEVATVTEADDVPLAVEPLPAVQDEPEEELEFGKQPTDHLTGAASTEEPPAASEVEPPEAEEQKAAVDVEVEKVPVQSLAKVTVPLALDVTNGAVMPLEVLIHSDKRPAIIVKGMLPRRLVRKRLQHVGRGKTKSKRTLQVISIAVLAAILLFVLLPVGAGFAAYGAYTNINAMAHDGINHLLKVKTLLNVSKSDLTTALNASKLQQAQVEFKAAEDDFDQLQQLVNRPDIQSAIAQFAPQYMNKLDEAQSLIQVALDVSRMGNELSGVGLLGANLLHASPLTAGSNKPLISSADVTAIEGAMVHALYYMSDIRDQLSHVSIKDLPLSDAQKAQLNAILPMLPKVQDAIVQAQELTGAVTWLLGVGHPRRFLLQTMDRAELRPGGGFTGQYGILQIQDGRVTPPTLTDVTLIDYAGNGTAVGRTAPPGYSWMNFGNWGIRDSNLSGDFPTTARMTMQLFQDEGGGPVDGDIAFTPTLIAHILDVIGPIKVPDYDETITSKNLEDKLHYYQQDFSAIARERQISGNYTHAGRKAFTSTLGKLLLDRVRHLQSKQLMEVIKGALKDIQSRDLEIYFANPAAEAWLIEHGYSGSIDTFSRVDGFMITQANISISKASQYVHTTEHDDITLDAQGGALHSLTITLDYQQKGPVYGYDTYADYIRVYSPKTAQFRDGDGFDTGHVLCSPTTPVRTPKAGNPAAPGTKPVGCGQYNYSFPSKARYCPGGNYSLGVRGGGTAWPIDSLGPPTAQTSDLSDRSMWAGLTETPKNCISTITLSWYVPNAVKMVNGQPSYTLLVQKQGGLVPTIELNIDASAIKGLKSLVFKGDITADKTFVLPTSSRKK